MSNRWQRHHIRTIISVQFYRRQSKVKPDPNHLYKFVLPRPHHDHSGKSVTTFKSLLDKHLSRIPDEPSLPGYSVQRCAETNSIINFKTVYCFKWSTRISLCSNSRRRHRRRRSLDGENVSKKTKTFVQDGNQT
jgi:hypothetical protein